MIVKYFWCLGSIIFIILGSIHTIYTLFTDKLSPKNNHLIKEMKSTSLILTQETTMWHAWIGFNASHSIGLLFIGTINFYMAIEYDDILYSDHFMLILNILVAGIFVWLGKYFWFKVPFIGVLITLVCYLIAYILAFI